MLIRDLVERDTSGQEYTVSYLKSHNYQVAGTMEDGSVKMQYKGWFRTMVFYVYRDGSWSEG